MLERRHRVPPGLAGWCQTNAGSEHAGCRSILLDVHVAMSEVVVNVGVRRGKTRTSRQEPNSAVIVAVIVSGDPLACEIGCNDLSYIGTQHGPCGGSPRTKSEKMPESSHDNGQ